MTAKRKFDQKRILLPLTKDEKVVICPRNSDIVSRGDTGHLVEVIDNLTVQVKWDAHTTRGGKSRMLGRPELSIRSYSVRKERDCHNCINRLTHIAGQACPVSWKEVRSIHDVEPNEVESAKEEKAS